MLSLADVLHANRVKVPLDGRTKEEVLRELVELAAGGHPPAAIEAILGAVRARELEMTTGFGSGIAVPHGRSPVVNELVLAAGVAAHPIDYGAVDGLPVQLLFLIIGPESSAGPHVRLLSRLARLLRRADVRQQLLAAPTSAQFIHVVRESEQT